MSTQIISSTQAKDKTQREAIDKLHAQAEANAKPGAELAPWRDPDALKADSAVRELRDKALRGELPFETLMSLEREVLEKIATGWELGKSATGWANTYALDHPYCILKEHQDRNIKDKSRFKATLWSRQIGKDFTMEGEIGEDLWFRPGSRWMVAAPSERQSLDSFDQLRTWVEAWGLVIDDYRETREGNTSEHLLKSAEVKLSNKSTAVAVPGRPDTLRGKSAGVAITEVDFLEKPLESTRALIPGISNPLRGGEKKLRYISTPNGINNVMYQTFTQPDGKLKWSKHRCNVLQAVLLGMPIDWEVLIEVFGSDHEGVAQELFCEFLDGSNVLLPYDIIQMSESLEASEVWDPIAAVLQAGPSYLGIDFGSITDPAVCWTLQPQGNCNWTREVLVLEGMASNLQQVALRERIRACARCCFDYTGPGRGLGDYLVAEHGEWAPEKHKFGKIELCTFTSNFKRDIFPKLRAAFEASLPGGDKVKATPLRIPVSKVIREDLHQMQVVVSNGEYNYWSPRTKLGHADRCTALALANRAADGPKGHVAHLPVKKAPRGGSRLAGLFGRR